jgi:16S rRNA (adenine1518-N6/adenine1519-N6)-dimethyltransferase
VTTNPRAKKHLGQHFLIDRAAVRRIVDTLDPRSGEPLLEIGPGPGALTAALIERCGRIAAVELDAELAAALRERFDERRLVLLREDVLRLDPSTVREALGTPATQPLAVAGNLPYNISKPIVMWLVAHRGAFERGVLMFQREVAQRLVAVPGGKDYGPLTILTGFAFEVAPVFDLRPGAFRPRPAVVSTVTRWTRREPPAVLERREPALRACLRACFAHRRRTLRNNLRAALGDATTAAQLLERAGIDGDLRAERIPPDGYLRLAEAWPEPAG